MMYMPIATSKERKKRRKMRYHDRIKPIYLIYAKTWMSRNPNMERNKRNMPDVVLLEAFALKAMKK
ncbi:hypothetical protein BOTCAL_0225g00230 [Botryotinia calthae]|uniref:Uncharacterized protein n=1 Tax=Botryotinia calthae TaxID=38488 RepID=A0A4Y8D0J2_9HELO|nr:hypothetical protein BOTCAL_0225g00230 [Botryotinia calthae]